MKIINDIREKYDPLVKHVSPHITLVFPFESDITTEELKDHLSKALPGVNAFPITLKGITPSTITGNYLFLNIVDGKEEIIEMHKRLYCGILESFEPEWLKNINYFPHMTVGNIEDDELFKTAIEETKCFCESFQTIVDEVTVEIIDENEDSIIEFDSTLAFGSKI
jgi:2'-5' RNA ligase